MSLEIMFIYAFIYKPNTKYMKYAIIGFPLVIIGQILVLSLKPINLKVINMHTICIIHTGMCIIYTLNYYKNHLMAKYKKGIKFEIPADKENIIKTNTEIRNDLVIQGNSLVSYIVNA